MKIRKATTEDLPVLLELEQGIIDSERPYDPYIRDDDVIYYDIHKLITGSDSIVAVVETDDRIVGCGYAQVRNSKACLTHDQHCYLGFIYLLPEYRGKSIGQEILSFLKSWGVEKGLQHFQLGVYSDIRGALRAYEKIGFKSISVVMELVV